MDNPNYSDFPQHEKFPLAVKHLTPGEVQAGQAHEHEFSEIIIVKDGCAKHCLGNLQFDIKRNDVLVVHPGISHTFAECKNLELYEIIYDHNIPLPALESSNLDFVKVLYPTEHPLSSVYPVSKLPEYDHELIINLICRLRYEIHRNRVGKNVMVPTMFVELVVYLARSDSQQYEKEEIWLLQAPVAYLSNNFREPFSMEKLTKLAGMSERSLFRHFKKHLGMSPLQYQQLIRVQHASKRLQHTLDSIDDIAYQCGFCDSNHLCKIFRKFTGFPPLKFRKKHQK